MKCQLQKIGRFFSFSFWRVTPIPLRGGTALISKFLIVQGIFLTPSLSAQISSSQILATAKSDVIFQLKKEQVTDLQNNPLRLPDWDDVEFRMENNRFESDRNEYALRLTRNPKNLKNQHTQIHQSLLQVADVESVIEFSNALEDRYDAILQAKFSEALRQKRSELTEVLEDQKRVITNRLAYGLTDDLEDLADIDEELQEEELAMLEFDFFKKQLSDQIADWLSDTPGDFSFEGFLTCEKMDTILKDIRQESVLNNPDIRRRNLRTDLAAQEEKLEQLEDQQLINFLQFRFQQDSDPDVLFREKLSVGMGLRLGQGRQQSIRAQEEKINKLEALNEVEIETVQLEREFAKDFEEVDFLRAKRSLLKKQLDDYRSNYSPEVFLQKGIAKPMTLLNLKETILKKEITLMKTEFELYETYLELLFLTGKPVEMPLKNYLDVGLVEF